MGTAALFIYSSYRTGGTAFAEAIKKDPTNILFYDPLNSALSFPDSPPNVMSNDWHSNHPPSIKYYESFLPLFRQGKMDLFPDLSEFKFKNSSAVFKDQLIQYLKLLIDFAHNQGKLPVFKLEQLKGHVNVLRINFPEALHFGLIRNQSDQFQSWNEQLALGESGFFNNALNMIKSDPDFFKTKQVQSELNPQEIFDTYYLRLKTLRSELDFTHDLYEESMKDLIDKVTSSIYKDVFISAAHNYNQILPRLSFEEKFKRMTLRSLELTQQRDELTQQRDELTQQRDELVNSTIWKITKSLRVLIDVFKKPLKRWN